MSIMSRLDRHDKLMTRMADRLGVDFAEAFYCGKIGPQSLRNAHFACVSCRESAACAEWLADTSAGAEAAPDYCRNKDLFARLSG